MAECWNCCEEIADSPADAYIRLHNPRWAEFPFAVEDITEIGGRALLCIDCAVGMDPDLVIPPLPSEIGQS